MLHISGVNPFAPLDPTSFSFTFSGLAITWGLVRFRLLDIVPAARDAVIESMSDGIIVLDVESQVVDLNPAAQDIVDRPPSEILGRSLAQVLPSYPQSMLEDAGSAETHEELTLDQNDVQHTYDVRMSSLHDPHGRLTAHLLVLRDITELKRAEEELRHRSGELEATNVQLQEAQEALVKAERLAAISQVAVTVAHEINNPLTPVLASAQWLLSSGSTLTAETREMVEHIEAGALRIRDVVRRLQEIVDRPVPYVGETQMIDIHAEDDPPEQEESAD
jgi:PAS domain S-box-containing protein